MFDYKMSKAVEITMRLGEFKTKDSLKDFLDLESVGKEVLSIDKVIYTFEDGSFICCNGDDIKGRPAGHSKDEFLH